MLAACNDICHAVLESDASRYNAGGKQQQDVPQQTDAAIPPSQQEVAYLGDSKQVLHLLGSVLLCCHLLHVV